MAKERKSRGQGRQRELNRRRRRLDRRQQRGSTVVARSANPKLLAKVNEVYTLIEGGRLTAAQEMLDHLVKRYPDYPAVVEAEVDLHQTTENHELGSRAAKRLLQLTPNDPNAWIYYAQASMMCGRFGLARMNYRRFLERWPDHPNAPKVKAALEHVEPGCEESMRQVGCQDHELLVLHDEALECLQARRYRETIEKFSEVLRRVPQFISARNNLALAHFHSGDVGEAIRVTRETCRVAPDNRFAQATLAKLLFLSGESEESNAIADRIAANPPKVGDALIAVLSLLGLLGRHEDVVVLSQAGRDIPEPVGRAFTQHYLAAAQCRLGDEVAARASWKRCLEAVPHFHAARQNLDDLNSGEGHAPWANSIEEWIPRTILEELVGRDGDADDERRVDVTRDYPAIAALVPALLDRGDPAGRNVALKLAFDDGSPAMVDALKNFAFGCRGPGALRHKALTWLHDEEHVDAGPHRFFVRGKWTEIKLFTAEISYEAEEHPCPELQRLLEDGTRALADGDYDLAEEMFQQVLEQEPDNCGAAFNQAMVWMERDGAAGKKRSLDRVRDLHERFPDYVFAAVQLAQVAAARGDLERAGELLRPVLDRKKLQWTEAIGLFAAQVHVAVAGRNFEHAEQALAMLREVAGADDSQVLDLQQFVEASRNPRRKRLLSWL